MNPYRRHVQQKEEWWRPLVSRAMMLLLGAALLWGGIKCIRTASWLRADHRARVERGEATDVRLGRRRDASGATLPMLAGIGLVTVGGAFAVLAVLPLNLMEKIGPGNTSLDQ